MSKALHTQQVTWIGGEKVYSTLGGCLYWEKEHLLKEVSSQFIGLCVTHSKCSHCRGSFWEMNSKLGWCGKLLKFSLSP